jgi:ATP-dependent helicase/nuclease subunit A
MLVLLELVAEFASDFAQAKRELGGIDFADQEQFALRLLYDEQGALTPVAHACRSQFRFVFVDECQDINAAQDAIIRAVTGEGAGANRFLVGDVKQSIYRFRLADPRIFQTCAREWKTAAPVMIPPAPPPAPPAPVRSGRRRRAESADQLLLPAFAELPTPESVVTVPPVPVPQGSVLPLSENFRSREGLLDFINPLFRGLMRPVIGGLTYDAEAELRFGAPENRAALAVQAEAAPRVELHVIKKAGGDSGEDAEEGNGRLGDLADLQSAEREARLVASRLKALKESGHPVWNRERGDFAPVEYRDMVVLLRGVSGRAEIFAKAFHQLGVPLHAERAGFLDSLEVTDLLSLLRLLDNPLQDVPLLAVLRSPLVGMSVAELAHLRLAQPRGLLWFAMLKLAEGSAPGAAKAKAFRAQYEGWRELIRHSALTHCLETALRETHYEALLLAGDRSAARVANVRRFVELARRFDPFQREGLFRFLQFIAEQETAEVRHQPAPLISENAVRLMTIHASKGLEFPVVALAGLGTKFNLRELRGDILLSEDLGLCPKIVVTESRKRYPSIAHWQAAQRERRALLGEEVRLLYVALTRARDTLILTGTASRKDELDDWQENLPITDHALVRGVSHLDWIRLWFRQAVTLQSWTSAAEGANQLLRWRFYDSQETARVTLALPPGPADDGFAGGLQLPTVEELSRLQARLAFRYANEAATIEPAKTSVSALRRRAMEVDEEARPLFRAKRRRTTSLGASARLSAAEIGNAHHAFMQFVDLARSGSELDLRNEAERLRHEGALSPEEIAALDFRALEAFGQSEVGQAFRSQALAHVHREMPFTARLGTADLRALGLPDLVLAEPEFMVVQGVVDLAAIVEREIWLLDFKTDHFKPEELPAKVTLYGPQLRLYALALSRIHRRPVTRCWLHFFATGTSEPITI